MSEASEQWTQIQKLFEATLNLPVEQRDEFLSKQTLPAELVTEVRSMLAAHSGPALAIEDTASRLTGEGITPERLGPYHIVREIGRGGMGKVYLAQRDDDTFDRQVAIKTLTRIVDTSAVRERFKQEQRLHARLEHPNIARLLDAGSTKDGKPFLIMQYVDGIPITKYVEAHACSIEQRVQLFIQICDAIAFAHGQLILHRDIKPPNMLVTEQGQSILLDFGIAKLLDDSNEVDAQVETKLGDQIMTLAYASPEQIREEELTTASDVYSLGVALYEILTGGRPFLGASNHALSEKIIKQDAALPMQPPSGQKIPRDLQAICLRAIEKSISDRYPTASALAEDLRRYLNHQVVEASHPGLFERFMKLWRRNPVTAPLAALATLVILISTGVAFWQSKQAQSERDIARGERDRSEQVVELLLDLFDSDPLAITEDRRDNITLREFLSSRAMSMEDELNDQPDLQATLFGLFANMYANLGQLEVAEPFAERSLSMRRALPGDQRIKVSESANTLATLRQYQGRYDAAEVLFREALAIRNELLPDTHYLVADSINNLGTLLYERGRPEDQAEIFEIDKQALSIRERRFGLDSVQVAESLNNIASSLLGRNEGDDWDKAESMYRRALTIRRDKLGDEHASTAVVISNLANLLHDKGQLQEAESLFIEAIDSTKKALGDNHLRVAAGMYGLNKLYQDQARWQEADELMRQSLKINQAALPKGHPYLFDDLTDLIRIQLGMANLPQATQFLSQVQAMKDLDEEQNKQLSALSEKINLMSAQ